MLKKIGGLLVSLFVIVASADQVYRDWKQYPGPTRTTVADYLNSDQSKVWVTLTDAKISLLEAVTVTGKKEEVSTGLSRLYIPIKSATLTRNDTISLLLDTNDAEILNVARQFLAMPEAKQLQFLLENRDKLIRSVELSGRVTGSDSLKIGKTEIRKHIENLAPHFYILEHNANLSENIVMGLIWVGIGLLLLTGSIWSFRK